MFATHGSTKTHSKLKKIPLNIQLFSEFAAIVFSTTNYLTLDRNQNILFNLFGNDKQKKDSIFKKSREKIIMALKMAFRSVFCCAPTIQYSYLRFCITKPSHVGNIH